MLILMIDNYDSFTYNLVQCFGELGVRLRVVRNDKITLEGIEAINPDKIVISPGPGTPNDAGISKDVIRRLGKKKWVLGVCLGHQCIGEVFGGTIKRADVVMHGKTSTIYHDGRGIYEGVESPFEAMRYHSLVVSNDAVPSCLEISAQTDGDVIMGARHRDYPIEGVQFHPESFLTAEGKKIIKNFVDL